MRKIAFYLPQFHPTPENNEWWGDGFTEWTNVTKSRPLFRGHIQPRYPTSLGYYDLRVSETRTAQSQLAISNGISAFCYWHYWFAGRRILERPFTEVLESGSPSVGFCLGWANQSWTGSWYGAHKRVLLEQTYPGEADNEAHFKAVLPAFLDDRYVKVDGRPLFYIFQPSGMPNIRQFVMQWHSLAKQQGFPGIFFVGERSQLLSGFIPSSGFHDEYNLDATVITRLPATESIQSKIHNTVRRKLLGGPNVFRYQSSFTPLVVDRTLVNVYPAIYPNWDHSPRSGRRGIVLTDHTPSKFSSHYEYATSIGLANKDEEQFVFIKSWNEWAEGNYLEPDRLWGTKFLEVLKQ